MFGPTSEQECAILKFHLDSSKRTNQIAENVTSTY